MRSKPPLSVGRIVGEILAGGVGGVVVGFVGLVVGINYAMHYLPMGKCNPVVDYAIRIGSVLGSTIGVYVVGNIGNGTGSFLATLGGSILGGLVGWSALVLGQPLVGLSALVLGQPIGATLGFNLTRKYKSGYENEPH